MKKLYLLPISLILLNSGFAEDLTTSPFSEVKIVSVEDVEGTPKLAFLDNGAKAALEIDPQLVEELKDEISAFLQASSTDTQDMIVDVSDAEIALDDYNRRGPSRIRQQLPQRKQPIVEEEYQEDAVEESYVPPRRETTHQPQQKAPARRYSSQAAQANEFEEDLRQESQEARPRAPQRSQAAKSPRAPSDTADAEFDQPVQPQRKAPSRRPAVDPRGQNAGQPRKAPQRPQGTKAPRAQSNTVEAERMPKQRAPQFQEEAAADAEFDQPVQQRKAPARRQYSPQGQAPRAPQGKARTPQRSASKPATSQQRVAQMNDSQMNYRQRQRNQMSQDQSGMQQQNNSEMMTNSPARPMLQNGYDLWVMGDVLLWQAVEENLTYAYTHEQANQHNLHTVDFDWDWGFRLGVGYNMPRDGWDLDLYWTHIRNTADGHVHANSGHSVTQVWTVASQLLAGTMEEAHADWRVHLDQLDLDLGRQFYVSKYLTLRPYVGMRSTWLLQRYNINTENTNELTQHARLKNRFWGFGFATGLDTDWKFGWGVSLYGEADMALLLGFHDVDQAGKQQDVSIWSQDKSFRVGRAILDLALGLKWADTFFHDCLGLTLKLGYEYHLYFDQNQFLLTNGSSTFELFNPLNGNLIYQGLTGSIQLDF